MSRAAQPSAERSRMRCALNEMSRRVIGPRTGSSYTPPPALNATGERLQFTKRLSPAAMYRAAVQAAPAAAPARARPAAMAAMPVTLAPVHLLGRSRGLALQRTHHIGGRSGRSRGSWRRGDGREREARRQRDAGDREERGDPFHLCVSLSGWRNDPRCGTVRRSTGDAAWLSGAPLPGFRHRD